MSNKKRIITIPDIHGCEYWKYALEEDADKYIFLGDYCDSYILPTSVIYKNLEEIVQTKIENPDKIELLLGNHELHYFIAVYGFENYYKCSGYRPEFHDLAYPLYLENKDLFNFVYQYQNHVWSHAGITERWFMHNKQRLYDATPKGNLSEKVNNLARTRNDYKVFEIGRSRGGLRDNIPGPLWADLTDTDGHSLTGIHQIVGHTPVKEIKRRERSTHTSITYTDTQMYNKIGKLSNFTKDKFKFLLTELEINKL